jgi:hypothetical protein
VLTLESRNTDRAEARFSKSFTFFHDFRGIFCMQACNVMLSVRTMRKEGVRKMANVRLGCAPDRSDSQSYRKSTLRD